jgi:phosphatidylethanolamine N-methyltransferase
VLANIFHNHHSSIFIAHVSLSYTIALKEQPTYPLLPAPFDVIIPAILAVFGQLLVISSTWALGITGTFLGDYFGILMDEVSLTFVGQGGWSADLHHCVQRIESFPFNWFSDPMYLGSTLTFTAGALWWVYPFPASCSHRTEVPYLRRQCPAGLLLTVLVYLVYKIALQFEGSVIRLFALLSNSLL